MIKQRLTLAAVLSAALTLVLAGATAPGDSAGPKELLAVPAARAQVAENPPPPRPRLIVPVSSWKLDESSGTTALDSWGSNPGTHSAGVLAGAAGLTAAGRSADYDGSAGRTTVNSSSSLNVTGALTLEAWARPDTLPASSAQTRTIMRKDGQYLLRVLSSGAVVFRLWVGGAAREAVTPAGAVVAGNLYHVVGTYDGASQTVYVNGVARATRAQAGAVDTTANPLLFGASSSGGVYDFFDGRLDDLAVYNTGVSASWVADRYNTGLCRPAYGSFGPGNWPASCWRPYAYDSPFNRPLPASPRVAANSAVVVGDMLAWGGRFSDLVAGSGVSECASAYWGDYQHPVYYAKTTDPVFTIKRAAGGYDSALYETTVRIPDAARPACGSDGHLTVIDQSTGLETDFWQVVRKDAGGGYIYVRGAGRTRIDGDGLNPPPPSGDANAARWGLMAGIIRAQELRSGSIEHALFMVVRCDNGSYVYPASGHGAPCRGANGNPNQTGPPMGARLQLNMSEAEINALPVPAYRKTILRALAKYGAVVGDTGGSPMDLQFESGRTYTSFGYEDEMVTFAREAGVTSYNGVFIFDLNSGVDWSRLRVIDPCVTRGDCPQ